MDIPSEHAGHVCGLGRYGAIMHGSCSDEVETEETGERRTSAFLLAALKKRFYIQFVDFWKSSKYILELS